MGGRGEEEDPGKRMKEEQLEKAGERRVSRGEYMRLLNPTKQRPWLWASQCWQFSSLEFWAICPVYWA